MPDDFLKFVKLNDAIAPTDVMILTVVREVNDCVVVTEIKRTSEVRNLSLIRVEADAEELRLVELRDRWLNPPEWLESWTSQF